jgi:glutathionylspermidine amidase/synthetase
MTLPSLMGIRITRWLRDRGGASQSSRPAPAPFGTVIGIAPCDVPAYSSHYASASLREKCRLLAGDKAHNNRQYYGIRWQCVEFARRWLISARGVTFADVDMAFQIFDLTHATRVSDQTKVAFDCVPNGSTPERARPALGSVLIWNEGGLFKWTGHVAIVTEVDDEFQFVRVAEQNVTDASWEGRNWSRQLPVTVEPCSGAFTIHEPAPQSSIRGWMNIDTLWVPPINDAQRARS